MCRALHLTSSATRCAAPCAVPLTAPRTAHERRAPLWQLLQSPPDGLLRLIEKRMEGSARNALGHRQRNGGSSTGGPRGHMECRGYGPCEVPWASAAEKKRDMVYDGDKCATFTKLDILQRM